jgi:flagellar biosynthesis protein FlhB
MDNTTDLNQAKHFRTQSSQQEIQATQPTSNFAHYSGNEMALMASIFYGVPIAILAITCLTTLVFRKAKLNREIQRLNQVASLERLLRLKLNEQH